MSEQTTSYAVPVSHQPRWVRLLWFSVFTGIFWYVQYLYQYRVFEEGNFAAAWIRSNALAGTTLIAGALLTSIVFKFYPGLARYWHLRRWLGVGGALLVFLHVLGVWKYGYNFAIKPIFFSWNPYLNPVLFGLVAFPILLGMFITSSDFAVRKLKRWWKFIHRFIYLAEVGIVFHVLLLGGELLKTPFGYLLYTVGGAALLGQAYWWFRISKGRGFKNAGFYLGGLLIITFLVLWYLGYRTQVLP